MWNLSCSHEKSCGSFDAVLHVHLRAYQSRLASKLVFNLIFNSHLTLLVGKYWILKCHYFSEIVPSIKSLYLIYHVDIGLIIFQDMGIGRRLVLNSYIYNIKLVWTKPPGYSYQPVGLISSALLPWWPEPSIVHVLYLIRHSRSTVHVLPVICTVMFAGERSSSK